MTILTRLPSERAAEGMARRDRPYVVTLTVRPGTPASGKPPVRIFLGSQDEQWRAERIFFYAIEQVRDPTRVYEIHVMKNLAGYVRKGWRTGFTNYRFAIPDYAGRTGKAIYNDVDQTYTADPALLFDLELGEHGYLAVSASDTSVMLLDCARMAECWNLDTATRGTKEQLLGRVKGRSGLWGPLDPGWNARDMEFVEGRSMLLHYTAMHTQPWHPFPRDYAYRHHPLGEVWYRLERAADAAGYQVFTRQQPSPLYQERIAQYRRSPHVDAGQAALPPAAAKLAATLDVQSVLRLGLQALGRDTSLGTPSPCHSHESGNPEQPPDRLPWTPAFALGDAPISGTAPAHSPAPCGRGLGEGSARRSAPEKPNIVGPVDRAELHESFAPTGARPRPQPPPTRGGGMHTESPRASPSAFAGATTGNVRSFDAVIADDLLQRLPAEDVPWLLGEMFGQARKLVYVAVDCQDAASSLCVREPGWWRRRSRPRRRGIRAWSGAWMRSTADPRA